MSVLNDHEELIVSNAEEAPTEGSDEAKLAALVRRLAGRVALLEQEVDDWRTKPKCEHGFPPSRCLESASCDGPRALASTGSPAKGACVHGVGTPGDCDLCADAFDKAHPPRADAGEAKASVCVRCGKGEVDLFWDFVGWVCIPTCAPTTKGESDGE